MAFAGSQQARDWGVFGGWCIVYFQWVLAT
jgi:hypothetical protein